MHQPEHELRGLAQKRWRVSLILTLLLSIAYFGFILLVAFNKELLASVISPGLSLGILFGAFLIVFSWLITGFYVQWANSHYDTEIERWLRTKGH